ncbi:MAG: hypothetical protein POG24_08980 [Acidocella sp.]|nr:hypothetical protein [Acidocella sp.]
MRDGWLDGLAATVPMSRRHARPETWLSPSHSDIGYPAHWLGEDLLPLVERMDGVGPAPRKRIIPPWNPG